MSAEVRHTYRALRAVLQARGLAAGALAGLTELATILREQRRLTPTAAAQWLETRHPELGEQTPLAVWLTGRADRVIDAARGGG